MDPVRFDGLVRTLSQARSRRQALRSLAGAAAATLALAGRGAGAQDCKDNGKACKKNSQCCSNNCVGATGDSRGVCQPASTCPVGTIPLFEPCPADCDPFATGGNSAPCAACCGGECFSAGIPGNCGPEAAAGTCC